MRVTLSSLVVLGSLALAACGDSTGPSAEPLLSRRITFSEFADRVTLESPIRVEIEAAAEGPPVLAQEIELEGVGGAAEEEEISSRALRFEDLVTSDTECRGTLVLSLGDVRVSFSAAGTDFEDEATEQDIACAEFVRRVTDALAAGEPVPIEAERAPSATAQAPDDPSFAARELKLDDELERPEIEINVDRDNLTDCDALADAPAGCLGVLRVLGVPVVLLESTELEARMPDFEGEVDFEGRVQSVDVGTGRVVLSDGTVIRIVAGSEIKESGDEDNLASLAAVSEALAAGRSVEAEGEGVVESTDPLTFVAIEAEFEVEG